MVDEENKSQDQDIDVTEPSALVTAMDQVIETLEGAPSEMPTPPAEPYVGDDTIAQPHEAIRVAQQVLLSGNVEIVDTPTNVQPYQVYGSNQAVDPITQRNPLSVFEKFPDVTQQLRDNTVDTTVDLYRVRKLNLAATVETLERAVSAHESFPNADAGIAVAKLAEQVSQLTRELEKSQDPFGIYDKICQQSLEPLTADIVKVLVEESRWLLQQFEPHVPEDKRSAFRDTVKQMALRAGPSLKDSLEVSKYRLLVALNLQDKKPK